MKRIFGTALLVALAALTVVAIQQTNNPASASVNPTGQPSATLGNE